MLNVNDSFRKTIIVRSNTKKWKDDKRILFLSLKEFLINPDSIKPDCSFNVASALNHKLARPCRNFS